MKKKRQQKMPMVRVRDNHLYLLRLLHRTCPTFVPLTLLTAFFSALAGFLGNVYFLRYALNGIGNGLSFQHIAVVLTVWLVIDIAIKGLRYAYHMRKAPLMVCEIQSRLPVCVLDEVCEHHIIETAADNYAAQIRFVVATTTNLILLWVIDPWLLLLAAVPLLAIPSRGWQHSLRTRLLNKSERIRTTKRTGDLLEQYRYAGQELRTMFRQQGHKLAAVGYLVAVLMEVSVEVGGMLYAVYCTINGRMGYGDCLVIVTAIGSLTHGLVHLPEMLLDLRKSAQAIQQIRSSCEEVAL